jgi:murein DD-endopeptidase MepM/ murein hydrolase activator NlpD
MIVPEGGDKVYSRNMPAGLFKLIIILFAIWIIFLIGVTIVYSKLSVQASKSAMLQDENRHLREYFTRVVEIENSFKRNQEFTARLAELAGINLQEMKSPAQINFDSLNTLVPDSLLHSKNTASNDSDLSPEDLLERHVPYGRPLYGWITKTFSDADNNSGEQHNGIDLAVKEGTAVSATAAGTVASAGWDDYLGNFVVIDHGNGYLTTYGHNKDLLVKKGDKVSRGEVIALSGNTGHSSAPHLHYEVMKNGVPVDPAPYLD